MFDRCPFSFLRLKISLKLAAFSDANNPGAHSTSVFSQEKEPLSMTKKRYKIYVTAMTLLWITAAMTVPVLAVDDMWTVANNIIVDVYSKIVSISTVLAGLMSAVAVIGAKISNNQHKTDQAWDWLKRIWIAWAIINGIGAFIAYVAPLFNGLATLTP